jgi:5-methylcytosine-specific restriction endonuclease McrA
MPYLGGARRDWKTSDEDPVGAAPEGVCEEAGALARLPEWKAGAKALGRQWQGRAIYSLAVTLRACTLGHIIPQGYKSCPRCEGARQAEWRGTDTYKRTVGHRRWTKVRDHVRERDGGVCQLAHRGECKGRLEVHHRTPVRHGGAPLDLENLVLVCKRHNYELDREFRLKRAEKLRYGPAKADF